MGTSFAFFFHCKFLNYQWTRGHMEEYDKHCGLTIRNGDIKQTQPFSWGWGCVMEHPDFVIGSMVGYGRGWIDVMFSFVLFLIGLDWTWLRCHFWAVMVVIFLIGLGWIGLRQYHFYNAC